MHLPKKLLWPLLLLVTVTLACGTSDTQPTPEENQEDRVATIVAATLTASEGEQEEIQPEPILTEEPIPTESLDPPATTAPPAYDFTK